MHFELGEVAIQLAEGFKSDSPGIGSKRENLPAIIKYNYFETIASKFILCGKMEPRTSLRVNHLLHSKQPSRIFWNWGAWPAQDSRSVMG